MKVLFDHKIFFLQKFGGISRYIFNLNKCLNQKINSKICAPIFVNQYIKDKNLQNINKHFYISEIPRFTRTIIDNYNKFFFNSFYNKFKPDILHLSYYEKNFSIKKKSKIVITIYDLIYEKFYYEYGLKKRNFWKKDYIDNCDLIISISENTKKDLIEFYNVNPNKVEVVHLGTNFLNIDKKIDVEKKNRENYLLYVGDRKRYKNFQLLIKAFAASEILKKNFKIFCCGSEKFDQSEIDYFQKLGIFKKVKFFYAQDNVLVNLYLNARSLIFPSKYEGFGLPLIEAMSLACPVLASKTKINQEILDNSAIYFKNDSFEDLRDVMEKNLFDDYKLESIKVLGLKRSKKFTWENCASQTIDLYKKIL